MFPGKPTFSEHFDIKYSFWQNMELHLCVIELSKCHLFHKQTCAVMHRSVPVYVAYVCSYFQDDCICFNIS